MRRITYQLSEKCQLTDGILSSTPEIHPQSFHCLELWNIKMFS